jgi:solute carrier family 35, member C2
MPASQDAGQPKISASVANAPVTAREYAITSSSTSLPRATGDTGRASGEAWDDDIEMSPIEANGHRRRTSSLIGGQHADGRAPRAPSLGRQGVEGHAAKPSMDGFAEAAEDDLLDEDLHDDEEAGLTGHDRRRKQQKRKHNTLLDQRIVHEKLTPAEKRQADRSVMRRLLVNAVLILLWYFFSLCISLVRTCALGLRDMTDAPPSTTSGCLTLESSTSPFLSLPLQSTC